MVRVDSFAVQVIYSAGFEVSTLTRVKRKKERLSLQASWKHRILTPKCNDITPECHEIDFNVDYHECATESA